MRDQTLIIEIVLAIWIAKIAPDTLRLTSFYLAKGCNKIMKKFGAYNIGLNGMGNLALFKAGDYQFTVLPRWGFMLLDEFIKKHFV